MVKEIVLSVVLATSFVGCMGGDGPDAKTAQGKYYMQYVEDRPSTDPVVLDIPQVKEVVGINKKLVLLSKVYKSSTLLADMVFNNAEIDILMNKNAEKFVALEAKIKGKPQAEQEKELIALLDKLEASPEFAKAKKNMATKGQEIQAEIKKMAMDELKDYLINELGMKFITGSAGGSNMGYMDMAKATFELRKVPTAISQVTYTVEVPAQIAIRQASNVIYAGQDATMFIKQSLVKSLTENLSEEDAVDANPKS